MVTSASALLRQEPFAFPGGAVVGCGRRDPLRAEERASPCRRGTAAGGAGGRSAGVTPALALFSGNFRSSSGAGCREGRLWALPAAPSQRPAKVSASLCAMRRCPPCCRLAVCDRTPVPVSRGFPGAVSASQAPLPANASSSAPSARGRSQLRGGRGRRGDALRCGKMRISAIGRCFARRAAQGYATLRLCERDGGGFPRPCPPPSGV